MLDQEYLKDKFIADHIARNYFYSFKYFYLLRWALRTSWWNRCCARTSPRGTLGSVYFTNRHILETVGKLKIKGIYWKSVFFFNSDTCWSCSHHCSSRGGRRPSASAIVTSYPVQIIIFCLPQHALFPLSLAKCPSTATTFSLLLILLSLASSYKKLLLKTHEMESEIYIKINIAMMFKSQSGFFVTIGSFLNYIMLQLLVGYHN